MGKELRKATEDQRMLADYLEKCVDEHSLVSLPAGSGDDVPFNVFQLLIKQKRMLTVPTWGVEDTDRHIVTWIVKPYDLFRPNDEDILADTTQITVFCSGDTCKLDMLDWITTLDGRHSVRIWTSRPSTLPGHEEWFNPERLRFQGSLMNDDSPVLALVDSLNAAGHVAKYGLVKHSKHSGLLYDARSVASKRSYLRLCLASKELYTKGLKAFRSDKSEAFYKLVLKFPTVDASSWDAKACRTKLKELKGEVTSDLPLVPHVAAVGRTSLVDADDGGLVSIADRSVPPPPARPMDEESDDSGNESSSSHNSKQSIVLPGHIDGDDDGKHIRFPKSVEGAKLKKPEQHLLGSDAGFRVTCPTHGSSCRRFRALGRDTGVFGHMAPVYYLGTWLRCSHLPVAEHQAYYPSVADVRAYVATL